MCNVQFAAGLKIDYGIRSVGNALNLISIYSLVSEYCTVGARAMEIPNESLMTVRKRLIEITNECLIRTMC